MLHEFAASVLNSAHIIYIEIQAGSITKYKSIANISLHRYASEMYFLSIAKLMQRSQCSIYMEERERSLISFAMAE